MKLDLNPDVAEIVTFMQERFPAGELVSLSQAVSMLAPALWGSYGSESIGPIASLTTSLAEIERAASSQ
jgi:hypothetical protein